MTDVALEQAGKAKSGLFTVAAMQKAVAFVVLVALLLFFTFSNENFMSQSNMVGIMQATAVNGVLAVACTFVIASAGIDLSVGTLMTFTAVMSGVFLTFWGLPMWLGVILVLLVGAAVGATSGLIISRLKVPPFIATLGMMLVLKGLSLVISGVHPIYFNDTPNYSMISADSFVSYYIPSFEVPNGVLILFGVAVIGSVILNKSILGRYIFALGSNEEAARLSGVNVNFWKIVTYSLGGLVCGIAGLLISSRLNSAQPALGQGYELDAIAATVIGGTSLAGGRGTILGTLIGAFIMSVLTNGLRINGVPEEWQLVVTGIIIIIAVYVDIILRKKA
jgi:ribose transport system permease protein